MDNAHILKNTGPGPETAVQSPDSPRPWGRLCAVATGVACFLAPALLCLLVFARLGVYPFGEKSLLVADMNNEYIDYLALMNETVRSSGSFLRSWNMGMGLNMLGLIAFYTASPFNLLVLLTPLEWITEAVFAILLLKIGLCGLSFFLYSRRVFCLPLWLSVAFSTAYGLMAYNIAYSSNIMWLDGVAFLPLVLLGVEHLLQNNRCRLFFFCLIYIFLTSYYIAFMIGLFSFLYLTAVWFAGSNDWRGYLARLWRFGACALLAAGCCAFLLLPAFLNLSSGQEQMWVPSASFSLETPLTLVLCRLLPGAFDTLTDAGTPNIYCSLAAAGGAALYLVNSKIPKRERRINAGITLALLFSFSCEILYLGWHAFEDPTWYPARFSFLFSFWLLYLAGRCVSRREGVTPWAAAGAALLLLLLVAEAAASRFTFLTSAYLWGTLGLVAVYAALCALAFRFPRARGVVCLALACLVCLETAANAWSVVEGVDGRFHYRTRESYTAFREENQPALDLLGAWDTGVYRTEVVEQRNANGAMGLGYNSISHYSTTTDQALNSFLKSLGYNTGIINELYFAPTTPVTNGLLGIKYVLSHTELPGYRLLAEEGEVLVYENPLAIPLAFWADEAALGFDPGQANADPFALQNRWVTSLYGVRGQVFRHLPAMSESLGGARAVDARDFIQYDRTTLSGDGWVEWTLENPMEQEVYAAFPVYENSFANAWVEVGETKYRDLAYRHNTVLYLGNEQEITVRLRFSSSRVRLADISFAALDTDMAALIAGMANEYAMDIERFGDTCVEGTVSAPWNGALVTTFPYDEGWRIVVDGKRVASQRYAGVFLGLPLEEGEHSVRMWYSPPGFLAGCAVSLLTAGGIAGGFFPPAAETPEGI